RATEMRDPHTRWWESLTRLVLRLTDSAVARWAWIVGLIVVPATLAVALKPRADFAPSPRADAGTVSFNVPPGVNNELFEEEIAPEIVERLRPYVEHREQPYIRGYILSMFGTFNILYLYPQNAVDTEAWVDLLRGPLLGGIPDVQAFDSRDRKSV